MGLGERSDAPGVTRRILTLPRVTAVAAAVLLVSATISLAAGKPVAQKPPAHVADRQGGAAPAVPGRGCAYPRTARPGGGPDVDRDDRDHGDAELRHDGRRNPLRLRPSRTDGHGPAFPGAAERAPRAHAHAERHP